MARIPGLLCENEEVRPDTFLMVMAIEAVPRALPQALSHVLSKLFSNLTLKAVMLIEAERRVDDAPKSFSADKITSSNWVKASWVWRVASLTLMEL
jgi:hypothetical protein